MGWVVRKRSVATAFCGVALASLALALVPSGPGRPAHAQGPAAGVCPAAPVPTISSAPPADVCIPSGFGQLPIQYFDDYSWRVFIAMVWPADPSHRGAPDTSRAFGDVSEPLVFETYKSEWELFPGDGSAPAAWNVFPSLTPCNPANVKPGDFVLASFSFSKFGNLGEAGQPPKPLVGTLVSQNGAYVRYSTGFNEVEYSRILAAKLYLTANQTNVAFAAGSIDVKSSWMDMTDVPDPNRYYTRTAWVFDLHNKTCSPKLVGLIGLHIVQKTPSRPQWIWTTFEHVDNVAPTTGHGMAINNGGPPPMGGDFPQANLWPPKDPTPPPYNVQRIKPIHNSTATTNTAYQTLVKGTVWANYQLVMTQWPVPNPPTLPAVPPSQNGKPAHTFPGANPPATTAFANTTMETFDQDTVTTGCMSCHTVTQSNTDFLWSLAVNGVTPAPPPPPGAQAQLMAALPPKPAFLAHPENRQFQALFKLMRSAQHP